jgi:hypothetical protein
VNAFGDDPERADAASGASATNVILTSVLTCPSCGTSALEPMPTNLCVVYYECTGCRAALRPKRGDCCVFCSYGSVPCPPMQESSGCCGKERGQPDD